LSFFFDIAQTSFDPLLNVIEIRLDAANIFSRNASAAKKNPENSEGKHKLLKQDVIPAKAGIQFVNFIFTNPGFPIETFVPSNNFDNVGTVPSPFKSSKRDGNDGFLKCPILHEFTGLQV
jgi:hypothetical protein